MNTNGNTYTIIYSAVLVVLVAAILAFVSLALADKQNENVKLETVSKVLGAAAQSDESFVIAEDADILGLYTGHITGAFYVDGNGVKVGEMNMGKENVRDIEVTTTSYLKSQDVIMKKIAGGEVALKANLKLPVYVFDINGRSITVIPCYGAGLWGPIWGYVALAEDGNTIVGAVFDHKGETPGLGAKITEDYFCESFLGKSFDLGGATAFEVAKPGHVIVPEHGVDAISGATITSQALGKSIDLWARNYAPYLSTLAVADQAEAADDVADQAVAETADAEDADANEDLGTIQSDKTMEE